MDNNGYRLPVFEVTSKDIILHDQDKYLVALEKEVISVDGVNGPEITLGSLTEVSTSGNWPTTYDSAGVRTIHIQDKQKNRLSILINRNGLSYLISDVENKNCC